MSTKSKRRAARRTTPEDAILGEIMGGLLSAMTFGALETEEEADATEVKGEESRPSDVHTLLKRQSHVVAARSTNARTFAESRRVV